jgi:hypothetical protein
MVHQAIVSEREMAKNEPGVTQKQADISARYLCINRVLHKKQARLEQNCGREIDQLQ